MLPDPQPAPPSIQINAVNGDYQYATFWQRVGAFFLDMIIVGAVYRAGYAALYPLLAPPPHADFMSTPWGWDYSLTGVFFGYNAAPGTLAFWLYFAIMESSRFQATFGKKLLQMIVTDTHGRRISFLRATGRFFGKFVSSAIFGIGYLMVAFTARHQGLHDLFADTLVLRRKTPEPPVIVIQR